MEDGRWSAALAHRERLLRIARARLASADDAEDVVQEALLRCVEYEALDLARIGPFLTTVTVRLCADVHRRSEEPERARRWLAPLLHDAADPADLVCREAESEIVASLVADLPERQRSVLVDRARGLSIPQISARHELTYKSVESALSRARSAMRAAVAASLAMAGLLVRHRRAATVVAVPASALALASLVVVAPGGGGSGGVPPAATRPVEVVRPAGGGGPGTAGRPPAAPAPAPAPDPASAPAAAAPARAVAPEPRPAEPILRTNDDVVRVKPDNDDRNAVERTLDCVDYGPDLVVVPEQQYVGFECRRAPTD